MLHQWRDKLLFYFAMPMWWQTIFINSGQILHTSTMEDLRTYMVHQEHQMDAHYKELRDGNKNKNSSKTTIEVFLVDALFSNPSSQRNNTGSSSNQNQYHENFRPHCSNNANSSHFTSHSICTPTTKASVPLSPQPVQVYFQHQSSNSNSHLLTHSNSNSTESLGVLAKTMMGV